MKRKEPLIMDEHSLNQETATFVERPWGNYFKLFQEPGAWVKRVEVKPQSRLSLQKHEKRSEKWIVVAGTGVAIVGEDEIPIEAGSVVNIPVGAVHRLCNTSSENKLVIIEVGTGPYLSENDIIRFQDDYKRDS